MSAAVAHAHSRDRLARIRAALPMREDEVPAVVPKAKPKSRARLEAVDTTAARCVYCGAVARRRGVPVACHAHSDLPGLEAGA